MTRLKSRLLIRAKRHARNRAQEAMRLQAAVVDQAQAYTQRDRSQQGAPDMGRVVYEEIR